MSILEAILLGILEGVTEFLPISSTGHLTVAEKLLGYTINDPDMTAFTAIIQVGAVLATLLYFRHDIRQILSDFFRGLNSAEERRKPGFRFAWAVILGSIPIAIIGLVFKYQIETTLRSLWFVGIALIAWSAVMFAADRMAKQNRHEKDVRWQDTLAIGIVQCLSLIPGVSRSGATISAGLFRGLDRVAVARLSFFLAIPALVAAAILQIVTQFDNITAGVGWGATIAGTAASFVVAYTTVAWLLKFISNHTYTPFIIYRVVLGSIILTLLATGTISAT